MGTKTKTRGEGSDMETSGEGDVTAEAEAGAEAGTADTETADEPAVDASNGATRSRGHVQYADANALVFADDLPENPDRDGAGRNLIYFNMLSAVKVACEADANKVGKWVQIAQFATSQGAKSAYEAIEAKARPIPEGEWEFEIRKFKRTDGKGRGSTLHARYLG